MPVAAAVAPLAGIATSVIGGIAGATNKRPPSLSQQQQSALNGQLQSDQRAADNSNIDPTLLNTNLDANARQLAGANDQVTHSLASRGLARSGVLAQGLENNAAQSSANQTSITNNLQNAAIQRQQFNQTMINQLLGIKDTPGQSTAGGFFAGAAAPAAYAIQNAANNYTPGSNQVPPSVPGTTGAVNNNTINSGVFGTVPFANTAATPNVS